MTTRSKSTPMLALMLCVCVIPSTARAQDERLRVSFAPALATVSGDAELALGGTLGYRVAKNLWFEGELTWIDNSGGELGDRDFPFAVTSASSATIGRVTDLVRGGNVRFGRGGGGGFPTIPGLPNFPVGPGIPVLGQIRASADGSTLIGTMGVRWEFPVETTRFRPYVAGGLGFNNTDRRFRLSGIPIIEDIDESRSDFGYALSAGTGASIQVVKQLWADVDAKYFRLSNDRNIVRLGGGVSYRF